MSYTPVELRHVRVGRSLFGYNRAMVEQLIEEVAHSFEATWRERGELAEKVEALEKQVEEHRQRENLLTQTLLAAEQAASDVKERARKEAEAIVLEAHSEARAIVRKAQNQREQLMTEARRIEGMLRAALGNVEEGTSRGAAELTSAPEQRRSRLPCRARRCRRPPRSTCRRRSGGHARLAARGHRRVHAATGRLRPTRSRRSRNRRAEVPQERHPETLRSRSWSGSQGRGRPISTGANEAQAGRVDWGCERRTDRAPGGTGRCPPRPRRPARGERGS